jgi:hypothetical protein
MRNSVSLSRRAEKFLAGLTDTALYGRLRTAIDSLQENARPFGCLKLAGEPDLTGFELGNTELFIRRRTKH